MPKTNQVNNDETLYDMSKRIIAECLTDAKQLLINAGFNEKVIRENPNVVVQIALKLAEIKGSLELLG